MREWPRQSERGVVLVHHHAPAPATAGAPRRAMCARRDMDCILSETIEGSLLRNCFVGVNSWGQVVSSRACRAAQQGAPLRKLRSANRSGRCFKSFSCKKCKPAAAVSLADCAGGECCGNCNFHGNSRLQNPFQKFRKDRVDRLEAAGFRKGEAVHPITSSSCRTSSYGGLS